MAGAGTVNIVMASLSVQLCMYGTAWLLMGLNFRLKRKVAILWSAGWFAGAVCTLLVFLSGAYIPFNVELPVNVCLASCFLLLQQGVDMFTGQPSRRWEFVVVLGAMLLVEVLLQMGDDWMMWRVSLFTVAACWPLGVTMWQMAQWLHRQRQSPMGMIVLVVSPLLVTMALFLIRLFFVTQGTTLNSMQFNQGTDFDLMAAMVFLVMLGGFNFSLASLVLGEVIARWRNLSQTDQLTGLANRRVMMHRLDEEHARYLRSGHRYTVIMLDLDYFKRINDTHGHGVGDQVLVGLADVLRHCQRSTDTLARTGGEEFMLLLPLTDQAGAAVQAGRVCQSVRDAKLATDAGVLTATLSLGVASVQPHDTSVNAVVSRADAALYHAKTAGRNRVELAAQGAP